MPRASWQTRSRALAGFAILTGTMLATANAAADVQQCAGAAERAQQFRDDGKYRSARAELLTCGREECPAMVRRDCMQWLNEVNQASPSVVVRAKDAAGADLGDVQVTIDGEVATDRIDGKPILVDPGPHVVGGRAPGLPAVEQNVIIQAGEKNRLIELRFATGNAPSDAPSAPPTSRGSTYGAAPWIIGGLGVASLAVAGTFAALGLSERSDLRLQPCASTATCSPSDVDSVHTKFLVADISAGVGIVALGVATFLFLTSGPKGDAAARPRIDVRAQGNAASATITARFH